LRPYITLRGRDADGIPLEVSPLELPTSETIYCDATSQRIEHNQENLCSNATQRDGLLQASK
jgi:hypothetical protein